MYNNIELIGRLTKDVELRTTSNNKKVCTMSLAVNRYDGKNKVTDYFTVTLWENLAELSSKYTHKGSLVHVQGEMISRTYQNKSGSNVLVWEVKCSKLTLLDSKSDNTQETPTKAKEDVEVVEAEVVAQPVDIPDDLESLPF